MYSTSLQAGTTRAWEKSDLGYWDNFKKSSHFADASVLANEQGKGYMWVPGIHAPGKERVGDR